MPRKKCACNVVKIGEIKMFVEKLSEARKLAKEINGTYRKVDSGWLVLSWAEYHVWINQK
jgi:hypothetical protein